MTSRPSTPTAAKRVNDTVETPMPSPTKRMTFLVWASAAAGRTPISIAGSSSATTLDVEVCRAGPGVSILRLIDEPPPS